MGNKKNFLGLRTGPFTATANSCGQRRHHLKAGKNTVTDAVLDLSFILYLAPGQIADEILQAHGFQCLTLEAAGGDQTTLAEMTNDPEDAATKKQYACPAGQTWRAQDGGKKTIDDESDDLLLIVSDYEGNPLGELLPHHGVAATEITPDDNKNTPRPVAQIKISVKGLSIEEHGGYAWMLHDEKNPLQVKLAVKKSEHYSAIEDHAAQKLASVPDPEPAKDDKQTTVDEHAVEGEAPKRKRGRPKKTDA